MACSKDGPDSSNSPIINSLENYVVITPDTDETERYELLDNAHSDFLQHFENEIRISQPESVTVPKQNTSSTASVNDSTATRSIHSRHGSDSNLTAATVFRTQDGTVIPAGTDPFIIAKLAGTGSDVYTYESSFATGSEKGNLPSVDSSNAGSGKKSTPGVAGAPSIGRGAGAKAVRRVVKDLREPSLSVSFPAKVGSYELKILRHPEDQHRARYLTEGSRGTVKDKTQQSHPTVKLCGYDQPINLQVFVGTEVGRMKPHGFYQACKISNKNSTPCAEKDIEGTTVIEIPLEPKNDMVAVVDCMGILKLRNADVEQRIGLAKSKKKSTSARLIFRVNIPRPDGVYQTLQVASTPIICTQPVGAPEISKKSIGSSSARGGDEMFIIGKNFMKGTVVMFEEVKNDRVVWSSEANIDQDFFQATHLVCTVPPYYPADIEPLRGPKEVQVVIHSNGRTSEPVPFIYNPISPAGTAMLMDVDKTLPPVTRVSSPDRVDLGTEQSTTELKSDNAGSLKRPYNPSPCEDLSLGAKSATMQLLGDGDECSSVLERSADVKEPCSEFMTSQQMRQTELLFQTFIDKSMVPVDTDSSSTLARLVSAAEVTDASIKSETEPFQAQQLRSNQSQGLAQEVNLAGNNMFDGSSLGTIDTGSNFLSPLSLHPSADSATMDFVHQQGQQLQQPGFQTGNITMEPKSNNNSSTMVSEQNAMQKAPSFTDDSLQVHMLMQLVTDVQDKLSGAPGVQFSPVAAVAPAAPNESPFALHNFPLDSAIQHHDMNNQVLFDFGHGAGVTFNPGYGTTIVDGFGSGHTAAAASISNNDSTIHSDMRGMSAHDQALNMAIQAAEQSMDVNISHSFDDRNNMANAATLGYHNIQPDDFVGDTKAPNFGSQNLTGDWCEEPMTGINHTPGGMTNRVGEVESAANGMQTMASNLDTPTRVRPLEFSSEKPTVGLQHGVLTNCHQMNDIRHEHAMESSSFLAAVGTQPDNGNCHFATIKPSSAGGFSLVGQQVVNPLDFSGQSVVHMDISSCHVAGGASANAMADFNTSASGNSIEGTGIIGGNMDHNIDSGVLLTGANPMMPTGAGSPCSLMDSPHSQRSFSNASQQQATIDHSGFANSQPIIGLDVNSRQIAGMNIPTEPAPLNVITPSVDGSSVTSMGSNLQQSLAELLDLQQQVAGVPAASLSPPAVRHPSLSMRDNPHHRSTPTSTTGDNMHPMAVAPPANTGSSLTAGLQNITGSILNPSGGLVQVTSSFGDSYGSGAGTQMYSQQTREIQYAGDFVQTPDTSWDQSHLQQQHDGKIKREKSIDEMMLEFLTGVSCSSSVSQDVEHLARVATDTLNTSGQSQAAVSGTPAGLLMTPCGDSIQQQQQSVPFVVTPHNVAASATGQPMLYVLDSSQNSCDSSAPLATTGLQQQQLPFHIIESNQMTTDARIIHLPSAVISQMIQKPADGSSPSPLVISSSNVTNAGPATVQMSPGLRYDGQQLAFQVPTAGDSSDQQHTGSPMYSASMQVVHHSTEHAVSSSQDSTQNNKKPILLYTLLTEDSTPATGPEHSTTMTSTSTTRMPFPDLSFDDINQVLNSTTQS